MANRYLHSQNIHDLVIRASRDTYTELTNQGYIVSINPSQEKNQYVGTSKKYYPDLIVWRPNSIGSNTGTAIIIEEVETEDSVNQVEAAQWKEYANLKISQFRLIVPVQSSATALQLITAMHIGVTEIWNYSFNGDKVYFNKYISLNSNRRW